MNKRLMLMGLVLVLLTGVVAGGAVLASGGDSGEPGGKESPVEVIVRGVDTSNASVGNDEVNDAGEPK